ncbi:MAG: hypothetical protein P8N76_27065 [Pirellulaceae bacterium]|nr:hypothetical protein [Pirellulaceae bacterium]
MQIVLQRSLDDAAQQGRAATLVADGDQERVEISLVEIDSIGCAFDRLIYRAARLNQLDAKQLRAIGAQLAQRVNYLLEPLRTIEMDGSASTLQLRSEQPQKCENGKRYYEVFAQTGLIRLCRYEKIAGQARACVPANVTREVLMQLVCDLSALNRG